MSTIRNIIWALQGKKTFILAFVAAALNLAIAFHWINIAPEQLLAINGVLVALGASTLSAKINRM